MTMPWSNSTSRLFLATVTSTSPLTVKADGATTSTRVDYQPPGASFTANQRVACGMVGRLLAVVAVRI